MFHTRCIGRDRCLVVCIEIISKAQVIIKIEMKITQRDIQFVWNTIRLRLMTSVLRKGDAPLQVIDSFVDLSDSEETMSAMPVQFRSFWMETDAPGIYRDSFFIMMH